MGVSRCSGDVGCVIGGCLVGVLMLFSDVWCLFGERLVDARWVFVGWTFGLWWILGGWLVGARWMFGGRMSGVWWVFGGCVVACSVDVWRASV